MNDPADYARTLIEDVVRKGGFLGEIHADTPRRTRRGWAADVKLTRGAYCARYHATLEGGHVRVALKSVWKV